VLAYKYHIDRGINMNAKQKTIEKQLAKELIAKYQPETVGNMEDVLN
jgi:hypothetical protein